MTGLGLITPLGNSVSATWNGLLAGRSGITRLGRLENLGLEACPSGAVKDFRPEGLLRSRHSRNMDRSTMLAVVAALEAISDAKLETGKPLGSRTGIVFGSSLGGHGLLEPWALAPRPRAALRMRPFTLSNILPDAASGHIAIRLGATGPNMAILSASATGASAVGEAAEIIRRGDADVMIAGAAEAPLTPVMLAGFVAMHAMATSVGDPAAACKPFDLNRTGFVVAEGAGALVLENLEHARMRGAGIYAELVGHGSANDAFDMVASEPGGRGPIFSMSMALKKAHLSREAIGYVNAHGTASKMNDRIETLAIKQVFGGRARQLPVSSTKSMTGHMMGAAGAVEAAISVLALHHQMLPPTINYETPDPDCDLDYVPNVARRATGMQAVLSHSIGLGGHNTSLIFQSTHT